MSPPEIPSPSFDSRWKQLPCCLPLPLFLKNDLLTGHELEELRSLKRDQAALVDYVILQSAGFFAGMQESAISWNVAMARVGKEGGVCGERSETVKEGSWWRDNWSLIIGDRPHEFKGRVWP